MDQTTTIRLDSLLSDQGFCARRKVKDFLAQNEVLINDQRVREPGIRVNPRTDFLKVNSKLHFLEAEKELRYFVLNKPKGILSAAADNAKRKTVLSFVP